MREPSKDHETLLTYWQENLGLQDWTVRLWDDCVPGADMGADRRGECEYDEPSRAAVIRMLAADRFPADAVLPYDYEQTLIHELLHCKFAILDNSGDDLHDRILHQMIDSLANALVTARRG